MAAKPPSVVVDNQHGASSVVVGNGSAPAKTKTYSTGSTQESTIKQRHFGAPEGYTNVGNGIVKDDDYRYYKMSDSQLLFQYQDAPVEGVYWIESLFGGSGAVRAGVEVGYKVIAYQTSRMAPNFVSFAIGSARRNALKESAGTAFLRNNLTAKLGGKTKQTPEYYWDRAGGNFNRAVESLGRASSGWESQLLRPGWILGPAAWFSDEK